MSADLDLLTPLQRYWGYSSFRPLQERIVRSIIAGRDTCVVMPTGGGKSLCYQLPAAMSPGKTVIVISPLIALMEDQVAQLVRRGFAAERIHFPLGATSIFIALPFSATSSKKRCGGSGSSWIGARGSANDLTRTPLR